MMRDTSKWSAEAQAAHQLGRVDGVRGVKPWWRIQVDRIVWWAVPFGVLWALGVDPQLAAQVAVVPFVAVFGLLWLALGILYIGAAGLVYLGRLGES
jgi:hypothetical protein